MQDYDDYEYPGENDSPADHPRRGRERLAGVEIQISEFHHLCDHLWEHTLFLRCCYLLLLLTTVYQFLDVWQGDLWVLPSFDGWSEHMNWLVELHVNLTDHDEELRDIGLSYRRTPGWLVEPELFHPESIGRIVEGHWQTPLVLSALYLNGLLAASVVARKIYLYSRKTYQRLVVTLSLCSLSFVGQTVALLVRVYVFVFFPTTCGTIAFVLNLLCLLPEGLSVGILYKIRSTTMFLSSLYESLNKEVCRQQPGLDGEDHVADIMQETRPWKDVIVDALSTGAKYTDGVRRRRPWTVDQYE